VKVTAINVTRITMHYSSKRMRRLVTSGLLPERGRGWADRVFAAYPPIRNGRILEEPCVNRAGFFSWQAAAMASQDSWPHPYCNLPDPRNATGKRDSGGNN